MNSDQLQQYLHRIGLTQVPPVNEQGLVILHQHQHRHIPFENFDVIAGREIALGTGRLYQKLVAERRGGYCFEVNGLLLDALQTLGFDARPLLGRVHLSGQPSGRSHQVCLVTLGRQRWLVDAGFGANTPRHPLRLIPGPETQIDYQRFRFAEHREYGLLLQAKDEGSTEWIDLYSLDLGFVCDGDIQYGNHFTSTHPESVFTNSCIAALATESGIITLLNDGLSVRNANQHSRISLNSEPEYRSALAHYFGIELPQEYWRPMMQCIRRTSSK